MEVVYYETRRGEQPAKQYVEGVAASGEGVVLALFRRCVELVAELGVRTTLPHARIINRRERVYEMRFGDHRVAFIEHAGQVVLLHGWRKRSQRLDKQEEAHALREAGDWRTRAS